MVVTSELAVDGWLRRLLAAPGDTRAAIPIVNCDFGELEQFATAGAVVGETARGIGVADGCAGCRVVAVGRLLGRLIGTGVCAGADAPLRLQAIVPNTIQMPISSIDRLCISILNPFAVYPAPFICN